MILLLVPLRELGRLTYTLPSAVANSTWINAMTGVTVTIVLKN